MSTLVKFLLICSLAFTSLAQADLVGTWSVSKDQLLKVYYKDDNHIRIDVGNGTYMLVSGDKTYTVMNQGGQMMVMDLASMGGAMQALGGAAMRQAKAQAQQYDTDSIKYKNTGKQEVVAGYKGSVYRVSIKGPAGKETHEFVAANHADVVTIQRAFQLIGERMAKSMMGEDVMGDLNQAMKMADKQGIGGILRYGQDMVLISLENKSISATNYAIPPGATIMSLPSFLR